MKHQLKMSHISKSTFMKLPISIAVSKLQKINKQINNRKINKEIVIIITTIVVVIIIIVIIIVIMLQRLQIF